MLIRHFFCRKVAPTVPKQHLSCKIKNGSAPRFLSSASSNKFNKLNKLASPEKLLVYEGPYSSQIRSFKIAGSMFAFCAVIAFPTLLLSTNASPFLIAGASASAFAPLIFIHWRTRKYVTKLFVYNDPQKVADARRGAKKINDDLRLIFETYNIFGQITKVETFISKLEPGLPDSGIWVMKNPSRQYFLEPEILQGDGYLHKISDRISKSVALDQREPSIRKI